MSIRRNLAVGLFTVGTGQVGAKVLSLITTVLVARMLGPEHWGIAATFLIILTALEAVSTISTDRQVVQARDGAEPGFLATAHLMMVVRGLAIAIAVLALSWPAAWLFGRPEALWAYQALALVPLVRGLAHLDVYVRQREYRFGPTATLEVVPAAAALLFGVPLAWWLGDYPAAFWLIVIRSLFPAAISHLIATQPYRWHCNRDIACQIMTFGWPLMCNGVIVYIVLQGDQTIVGVAYDMPTLGIYAAAFTLASVPTQIVASLASTILLPALSDVQQDSHAFIRRIAGAAEATALLGGILGIGLIMLSPTVVDVLYGEQYRRAAELVSILAAAWSLRLLRVAPTMAAMARTDTLNLLMSNIWRCVGLGLAIIAAATGADVRLIAVSAVLGELCGIAASCVILRKRHAVPLRTSGTPALVCSVFLLVALIARHLLEVSPLWPAVVTTIGLIVLLITSVAATCPKAAYELRATVSAANRYMNARRQRHGGR